MSTHQLSSCRLPPRGPTFSSVASGSPDWDDSEYLGRELVIKDLMLETGLGYRFWSHALRTGACRSIPRVNGAGPWRTYEAWAYRDFLQVAGPPFGIGGKKRRR